MKSVSGMDTIKFLGHFISNEEIKMNPEKLLAITKLPRPQNVPKVRRLLGMINHIGKFAPNLAETTNPLRELLKQETSWKWGEPQEKAFQTLKQQLNTAPVLIPYSPKKQTKVCFILRNGRCFASKTSRRVEACFLCLKTTLQHREKIRSSDVVKKIADFLCRTVQFHNETDHKPLLALMKLKHLDKLTPRIRRFRMGMMRFSYNIFMLQGRACYC